MARYLKSQQQQIDTLFEGEPGGAPRRNVNARIAPRSSMRLARARKAKNAKVPH